MVRVRWYSARNESWQLGTIKERVGNKMYKIFIHEFQVCCIKHVDQILKYSGNEPSERPIINSDESHQSSGSRAPVAAPNAGQIAEKPTLPASAQPAPVQPSIRMGTDETGAPLTPNAEREADVGDGEEWADCEDRECERGQDEVVSVEASLQPTTSSAQREFTPPSERETPTPTPTPASPTLSRPKAQAC